MSNQNALSVTGYINNSSVQKRINDLLGSRSSQLTTSLISAVNANDSLAKCRPETVLNAALTAASMDLPINQNLGFAYIIPYGNEAQFQMGYKGFIQLAQRSGYYKTINTTDVREGEIKSVDRLTGEIEFIWIEDEEDRESRKVIGYVAYFKLLNGFDKSLYMSQAKVETHAGKYSKSYGYDKSSNKSSSKWTTDFEAMALKTVLKLLISRFGPLSTQLQEALDKDQSVITEDGRKFVDNETPASLDKKAIVNESIQKSLDKAKDLENADS